MSRDQAAETQEHEGGCHPCSDLQTKDWYAWINLMPPPPDELHVVGEVYVPNPGVEALLVPHVPPGINPQILLLDLYLIQRPGIWPAVFVWKTARYDKVLRKSRYEEVHILCGDDVIATIPVEEIH